MLPLGRSSEKRARVGAIGRLALTPPGMSTNKVLHQIVSDIVKLTKTGFSRLDANDSEIQIFLDCVGFIAHCPAVSETLEVVGHTSNAPCHLCFLTRYDKSGVAR